MNELEEIAEALGLDIDAPLPDISDSEIVWELGNQFTDECLEELEAGERAELESMAHAHDVPVWG